MYPPIEPYEKGRLDIRASQFPVADIPPVVCNDPLVVVFLHGGPGGGVDPKDRQFFNPDKYKIVLFDQRGAGKSTPSACIDHNTTWDLVADIERLRDKLSIEKWHVFGGSWGSTLALAYAQTHPNRVRSLVLRGIFTLRKSELRFFYQDGTSHLFPEEWSRYLRPVEPRKRDDMIKAYHSLLEDPDEKIRLGAAKAWSRWEMATSRLFVSQDSLERAEEDDFALSFARIENHYFVNDGFMRDGQLLEEQSIAKIRHIPIIVVQGRYDVVCPPTTAWALKMAWEANGAESASFTFHLVQDAGHSSREPGIEKKLVEAADEVVEKY
ncbi:Alpha/Beta hydrolase protein [Pisolithus orientalis]|uniref:Alpha/Beta hydrolase protein n=1 Tax=Pisolithus orientalis TaxID=936130 RepID=UPI0022244FC2|nr:Alpha/Beta hydrolase protein [Pisolithus orientalis]KAI6025875.1 Alpha/Beta hydrolase protein [Pisolithus orientalis]